MIQRETRPLTAAERELVQSMSREPLIDLSDFSIGDIIVYGFIAIAGSYVVALIVLLLPLLLVFKLAGWQPPSSSSSARAVAVCVPLLAPVGLVIWLWRCHRRRCRAVLRDLHADQVEVLRFTAEDAALLVPFEDEDYAYFIQADPDTIVAVDIGQLCPADDWFERRQQDPAFQPDPAEVEEFDEFLRREVTVVRAPLGNRTLSVESSGDPIMPSRIIEAEEEIASPVTADERIAIIPGRLETLREDLARYGRERTARRRRRAKSGYRQ